jgi:hypothetical protein
MLTRAADRSDSDRHYRSIGIELLQHRHLTARAPRLSLALVGADRRNLGLALLALVGEASPVFGRWLVLVVKLLGRSPVHTGSHEIFHTLSSGFLGKLCLVSRHLGIVALATSGECHCDKQK